MADIPLQDLGSSFYNMCLSWVDRTLNIGNWGGLSAAQAFSTFKGSQQSTGNPQKGDIILFGSNSASGAGHAGICATDGCTSVLSDLPSGAGTGQLHLTDLPTLISFEGGSNPVFVQANTISSSARAAALAAIQAVDVQNAISKIGVTDIPTGDIIKTPTQTGTSIQTGTTASPTGSGLPSNQECNAPTGANVVNPFAWISYWLCVISYDLRRVGWIVVGLVIVFIGLHFMAQDSQTPDIIVKPVQGTEKAVGSAAKTTAIAAAA